MTIDVTAARALLLGVPINCVDAAASRAYGSFALGAAYAGSNMFNRYLGQTGVLRPPVVTGANATQRITIYPGAGLVDGIALCSTDFGPDTTIRVRYLPAATGQYPWIENEAPIMTGRYWKTLSGSVAFTRMNALTTGMMCGAWIYPTAIDGTERAIISMKAGGTTNYPFELSIMSGAVNPKLHFRCTHSGGTPVSIDSSESAALGVNKWQHVSFTISSDGDIEFYVNGVLTGASTIGASTRDVSTGTQAEVLRGNSGSALSCYISDLRLYTYAITNAYPFSHNALPLDDSTCVLWFPFAHCCSSGGTTEWSAAVTDRSLTDEVTSGTTDGSGTTGAFLALSSGSQPSYTTRTGAIGSPVEAQAVVAAFDALFTDEQHARRRRDIYALFASPIPSGAAIQIDLNDPDMNGGSTRSIGRIIAGPALQLSRGVKWTGPLSANDPSLVTMTPAGQLFARQYTPFRSHEVQWDGMTTAEAMRVLEELAFVKGNVGDFYFITDPTTRDFARQRSFLARCASAQSFPYDGSTWQINAAMEEIR